MELTPQSDPRECPIPFRRHMREAFVGAHVGNVDWRERIVGQHDNGFTGHGSLKPTPDEQRWQRTFQSAQIENLRSCRAHRSKSTRTGT